MDTGHHLLPLSVQTWSRSGAPCLPQSGYPSERIFLASFCRWLSLVEGCGHSSLSALFFRSLQYWYNHKGGAACVDPALYPWDTDSNLEKPLAGEVHEGFSLQS